MSEIAKHSRRAQAQSRKKTEAIDHEEVKPANGTDHFERLCCEWLRARALYAEPNQDELEIGERARACEEVARQLLAVPVFLDWMVWRKWEVLEFFLDEDAIDGKATDNRTVMALGCIKADLISLGIGDGGRSA
jgi:hypothetical protein